MQESGKLYEKGDIKLLILYVLKNINRAVSPNNLNDIFLSSGLVDYFLLAECINELVKSGHLSIDTEENLAVPTRLGLQTADTISKTLPLYARERAMKSALETLTVISRNSQTVCNTEETPEGLKVTLKIVEANTELFGITLLVPSEVQAHIITERFKKSPEIIYKKAISLLTSESDK